MDLVYFNPKVRGIGVDSWVDNKFKSNLQLRLSDLYPDFKLPCSKTERVKKRRRASGQDSYWKNDRMQRRLVRFPTLAELCMKTFLSNIKAHIAFKFFPEKGMWNVPQEMSHKIIAHGVMVPAYLDLFAGSLVKHGGSYHGQSHITFAQFAGFINWFFTEQLGDNFMKTGFRRRDSVFPSALSSRDPLSNSRFWSEGNHRIDFLGLWGPETCQGGSITTRLYECIGVDYLDMSLARSKWAISRIMYADGRRDRVLYSRNRRAFDKFRESFREDFSTHYGQYLSGVSLSNGYIASLEFQRCVVLNTNRSNAIASAQDLFHFRLGPSCCSPRFEYLSPKEDTYEMPPWGDYGTTVRIILDHKLGVPLFVAIPELDQFVLFSQDTCCFWVMNRLMSGQSIPIGSISIGDRIEATLDQAYLFDTVDQYREFLLANQPAHKASQIERLGSFSVTSRRFLMLSSRPYYCVYPSSSRHLLRIYIPLLSTTMLHCREYKLAADGKTTVSVEMLDIRVPELCMVEIIVDASSPSFETRRFNGSSIHPKDFDSCVISITANRAPFKGGENTSMCMQRILEWDAFMDCATITLGQDLWLKSHKLNDVANSRFITEPASFPWTKSFTFTPECREMTAAAAAAANNQSPDQGQSKKRAATDSCGHDQKAVRDALIATKKLVGGVDLLFDTNILSPQFAYIMRLDFDILHKRYNTIYGVLDNEKTFENVFPFDAPNVVAVFDLYTWWRHTIETQAAKKKKQAVRNEFDV